MKIALRRVLGRFGIGIDEDEVEDWFADRDVFFVSGMGRSGTKFLAELLDTDRDAAVYHEPVRRDFEAVVEAQHDRHAARRYIQSYRKQEIFVRVRDLSVQTYGEVNSALRYHLGALRRSVPGVRLLHLVRDGRDVVRSLMDRRHYTSDGEGHHRLSPLSSTKLGRRWPSLSRFEKNCWLWADAVDRVEGEADGRVQLEKLTDDYGYFQRRIEDYVDLEIGRDTWEARTARPENVTDSHSFPHWTDWNPAQKEQFARYCGDQMRRVGYW